MFSKLFKLILLLLVLTQTKVCYYIMRPTKTWANNKFGIHILEVDEVEQASKLVNSSGGDWGYVTFVLREDDLNFQKWQKFFDDCRKLHLIPIVRIATQMSDNYWTKPNLNDLEKWPKFLGSLNWPVKEQIVVIFNEPNHSKEWGGEINPQEYAQVLEKLIDLFKKENSNFFILNAGLDQAADGKNNTMTEEAFLKEMFNTNLDIFNKLDGWASHSYPNHGFVGLPQDSGRASISGYLWEQEVLKNLGLIKNLPIYITETGWPHKEGLVDNPSFYESKKTAQFINEAFAYWLKIDRIKSITPFVLDYNSEPFDHFSWIKKEGGTYEQFDKVAAIFKNKAIAEQVESFEVLNIKLADILPTNYKYKGKVKIKNTGQWIMGEREDFVLEVKENCIEESRCSQITQHPVLDKARLVYPGEEVELDFEIKTGTKSAECNLSFASKNHTIYIYKPFDLKNKKVGLGKQIINRIKLWWYDFREKK